MKKYLLLLLTLLLMACGTSEPAAVVEEAVQETADTASAATETETEAVTTETADDSFRLSADYDDALPVQTQLAIGILNMENSESPMDEATAMKILPLWRALQALGESENTAQAELDAVLKQIQKDIPTEQLQTITNMQLTQETLQERIESGEIQLQPEGAAGGQGGGGFGRPQGGGGGGGAAGGAGGGQQGGGGAGGGQQGGGAGGGADGAGGRGQGGPGGGQIGRRLMGLVTNVLAAKAGEEIVAPVNPVQIIRELVAESLGMSADELDAEVEAGKTFAEVIAEKEGDLAEITADSLTALEDTQFGQRDGTEERITDILNGQGQGGRPQQGGDGEGGRQQQNNDEGDGDGG